MDWPNERYVRVYTRDTTTWKLLDWRGRIVLSLLFRKVDRAGVLDVGHDGVLGLAAVLELPIEIAEAGIAQLTTARGGMPTVVDTGTAYVLPNFIEAQEAPQSDPQRKRESRARRRDVALAVSRNLLLAAGSGPEGHKTGLDRDENSDEVTPIRSVPILADPDLSLSRAIGGEAPEHGVMGHQGTDRASVTSLAGDRSDASAPRADEPIAAPARRASEAIAAPNVPAASPPPARREDNARTQPAADRAQPTLDQLWTELEQARQRAAAARGVSVRPLVAHDSGRADLAAALAEAARVGKRAELVADVRHAIAAAEAESRIVPELGKRDQLQWFTGAIFSPRNFRRLAGTPVKSARARPAPAPVQTAARSESEQLTPEDREAIAELARKVGAGRADAAAAEERARRAPRDLGAAQLVRMFGDGGERAPPRPASEPSDADQSMKPEPAKATP